MHFKDLSGKSDPKMPWVSPAILHSINHKNNLFKEKLRNPTMSNIIKYNQYRNMLTKIIRSAKRKYYLTEFEKHSSNSKETWKTLQNLIKSKQQTDNIPSTIANSEGEIHQGDEAVAEAFNVFFTEVGTNLRKNIPRSSFDPLLLIPNVSEEMQLELTCKQEIIVTINAFKKMLELERTTLILKYSNYHMSVYWTL